MASPRRITDPQVFLGNGLFEQLQTETIRTGRSRPERSAVDVIATGLRQMVRSSRICSGVRRIHGELLKLGFAVAQSTVAKYMIKRRDPSSQGWGTFLHNHAPHIAAKRQESLKCQQHG